MVILMISGAPVSVLLWTVQGRPVVLIPPRFFVLRLRPEHTN